MKKILLAILMIFICAAPSMAQKENKEEMRKELVEFKIKFLAQEMELKEDQKKQFEGLYSKLEQEKETACGHAFRLHHKVKHDKNATEEDYAKAALEMEKAKVKKAELEKKYDEQFKKFLTQKQMFKMKEAEQAFMERMREMRHSKKDLKKSLKK